MDFWQRKNSKTSEKSNAPTHNVNWEGHSVLVYYKDIRTIRLSISTAGEIKLSLPTKYPVKDALSFLDQKSEWIFKHLKRIESINAQSPKDLSKIAFLGKTYPTEIHFSSIAPRLVLDSNDVLHVYLKPGTELKKVDGILDAYYRKELLKIVEPLVREWEPVMGVHVAFICLKRMKTRWGTCNVIDHRIWFNTELARFSYPCIEYIVVHEMCHLHERGHGPAFKALMDKYLPHWKKLRQELNGKGIYY